jgi:hypothetical protein
MKVKSIPSLALALATSALLGGTVLAAGGPGPQQPRTDWMRHSAALNEPPRTVQTGNTTVALAGHRYTTEEDIPASRAAETRRPQFTNFGQGNNTVRY